jgi:hypothetical protein
MATKGGPERPPGRSQDGAATRRPRSQDPGPRPEVTGRRRGQSLSFVDDARLDDLMDAVEIDDVLERFPVAGHEVGQLAGIERADLLGPPEGVVPVPGPGLEDVPRR